MTSQGTFLAPGEEANNINNRVAPRRRLVKFIKNEPGYRIAQVINATLMLNGIIVGVFGVLSIMNPNPTESDVFDIIDIVGIYFFCMWNSLFLTAILVFPVITTTHRIRFLVAFYLNGLSVILIRVSDFFRPMTSFQRFVSVIIHIFSYLLFMAIFNIFFGMPEDLYEISRTGSMKPWQPVYETVEDSSQNDNLINNNFV